MQAVILSAGKGLRMGILTRETPKPMLCVSDKTLLEHKLEALPESIEEIILVIGYRGELIKEKFGNAYKGIPITYIDDHTLSGTAHALWNCKEHLRGPFLVLMGDDIYSKESLLEASRRVPSIVCKRATPEESGSRIILDESGSLADFVTQGSYLSNHTDGGLIFTGLYSLDKGIFAYEPVKMRTRDEWGLPQTLLSYAKDHKIEIIETDHWLSVGTPDELEAAERFFKKSV